MSDVSLHPQYANPVIAEALCEIHFSYPLDQDWRDSRYGELLKALQPDFPTMESKIELGFGSERDSGSRSEIPVRHRNFYRHASRPLLCQLREGVFTVNELPVYPGWHTMLDDVLGLWGRAAPTLQYDSITRVGLRYINRIPKESEEETARNWLRPTKYIAESMSDSESGFYSRVRFAKSRSDRVIVTVSEAKADDQHSFGDIVFDIDRIAEKPIAQSELGQELDGLHNDVWSAFADALTPRLEKYLSNGASDDTDNG